MKKISAIFFLIILLFPFYIKAFTIGNGKLGSGLPSIQGSTISAPDKVMIGEEFSVTFNIQFSGLFKNMPDTFGLFTVAFGLQFDDSIFTITSVAINDWVTTVNSVGEGYLVQSLVNEKSSSNKCIDGILYCSNYFVTIEFKVNDTEQTTSNIQMGNMAVGLLNVDYAEGLSEATNIIEGISNQIKTITIIKEMPKVSEQPKVIETEPPKEPIKSVEQQEVEVLAKSDNNYLKTLTIENYKIDFSKTKKEYTIFVDKDVNQLAIHAEVEDSKANYHIMGADNLEQNNYQVQIEVIAENGDKNIYQLHVTPEQESGLLYESKKENSFVWKNSYTIISVLIIIFSIIVAIIMKIKDKEMDKKLDEL